jgi:hypothetical protein
MLPIDYYSDSSTNQRATSEGSEEGEKRSETGDELFDKETIL